VLVTRCSLLSRCAIDLDRGCRCGRTDCSGRRRRSAWSSGVWPARGVYGTLPGDCERLGLPSRRLRSKRVAHLRHPSRWWRAKSAGLLQIQMVLRTCKRNVKKSGVWFTFQTMDVVIDGPQEQRSLGARTVRSSGRRERWPLGAMAVRSRGRRSSGPQNSRRARGTSEQRSTAVGARGHLVTRRCPSGSKN